MTFKTWINDLRDVQSVINNISNTRVIIDGATGLLNANSLKEMSSAVSGLSKEQALLVLSTKKLNAAQQKQVLLAAGIISSENNITASAISQALAKTQLSATEKEALLTKLGLIDATTGEAIANATCTKEELLKILATKGIIGADADAIISSIGLTSANSAQAISFDLLTASIWANIKALGKWLITNPVGWAILGGTAIFGLVKAYDALTDSVEEVQERTDKLLNSYNSAISEANSNAKTIESLADRYGELSKGVNNLGENVSLTSDEYSEYKGIVDQIAEMFPTLITGYTDEGTAILSLKGNVEKLRDAYKEAQTEAYNLLIVSGEDTDGNDIISNYKNQVNGNESWLSKQSSYIDGEGGAKDAIDIIIKLTGALTPDEFRNTYNELYEQYKNIWNSDKIQDALKSSGFEELSHAPKWGELTSDDLAKVKSTAQATIQTYKAEIDSQLKNVDTLANAYLMTNEDYSKLDDQSKTAASLIVNSITEDIANGFHSKEDVGAYVADIVSQLKDNPDLSEAMIGLFTTDLSDMSVNDAKDVVDQYINTIAKILDEDPVELKVRLGFDDYNDDDIEPLKTKVQGFLKDEFDDKVGELSLDDLQVASKLEIPEGTLLSWDELKQKIEETKNAASEETPISSTFKDLWKSIGKGDDDASKAAKSAKEEILKLAEAGKLTEKAFKKSSIADTFLKAGYSIAEATKKINKMVDSSKQLSSLKSSISSIQNAYQEKKDNKVANSSTLAGMEDTFGKLSSWEKYKNILGSASSTLKECRVAQNELATEFVYSNNFLSQLTSKNREYYASQLKELGIANAQSIVEDTLKAKKQALANKTKALEAATSDLSGETSDASEKFLEQANMTNLAKVELVNLITQQKIFGVQGLDTSTKVEQLNKLALAYFGVANAIQVSNTSAMGVDPRYYTDDWIQKQWNNLMDQQTKISVDNVKVTPSKTKDSSKKTKNSSKSSNSNSKDTKQEIDWLSRRLTRMQSIIDLTASKLKNLFKIDEKENNINKQIKQTTKLINQYGHAYDVYMSKANKVAKASGKGKNKVSALSKDIINKIQSGEITKSSYKKLIKKYGKDYADKINEYIDYYDKAQDSLKSKEEQIANKRELKKSKIQLRIDDTQSKIDRADTRIENVASASEKNKILDNEKKYYKELYNQKIKQAKLDKDSVEVGKLKAEQKKQERDLSIEQHQNNIDEKQSALDVLEAQKENVTSASEKNVIIDQELALKKEICNEELAIAKLNGNQNEQERLKKQLLFEEKKAQLEQIANTKDEFDLKKNALSRDEAELQQQIAENEAKGVGQSIKDYRKQIALSEGRQKKLRDEKEYWEAYLAEQIASGKIIANESDAAYKELKDNIASCNEGISQCTVDQINYNKAIREMNVENYKTAISLLDSMIDKYKRLQSLADVHNSKLSDEDILVQIGLNDKKIAENNKYLSILKDNIKTYLTDELHMSAENVEEFINLMENSPHKLRGFMNDLGFKDFNEKTFPDLVDNFNEYNSTMNDTNSLMVDQENQLDSLAQKRIDTLNEYLEALKKQKEYKDRIFAIEKAQYDLEKAKNNLTKKVWDGQQWVYTADTEAVQSAQETLDNTMFDNFTSAIEDMIDVLEKFIKDFNIYDDYGNKINKPEGILNKDVIGEYTIVDIDKIFTDKVLDTSKLSGLMSNIQYAIPNVSIPNINLPKIQSRAMNQTVNYDKIELILPNITDASTGADLAKSFVNELKNLSSYAKQYDWNK